jgi:hypothetical protein
LGDLGGELVDAVALLTESDPRALLDDLAARAFGPISIADAGQACEGCGCAFEPNRLWRVSARTRVGCELAIDASTRNRRRIRSGASSPRGTRRALVADLSCRVVTRAEWKAWGEALVQRELDLSAEVDWLLSTRLIDDPEFDRWRKRVFADLRAANAAVVAWCEQEPPRDDDDG